MMSSIVLVTVVAVLIFLYKLVKKPADFWKNKPVKYVPAWPFVGNYGNQAFGNKAFPHVVRDLYNHFPNERYVGITMYFTPSLMIRDVDLIKSIAIKDFDHFTDHCGSELETVDPLMCKNLFFLPGQRWKHMRDTLSPAFTSAKMKAMFGLMSVCAKQFLDHLDSHGNAALIEIEIREMLSRYTNDVIATCAYGVEVNSFKDKDNEFFATGKGAVSFIGWKGIKFLLLQSWPQLLKYLRIPILGPKETHFFRTLTDETIAHREKTHLIRPDMIHLLMQAQKGGIKTDEQTGENSFATPHQQSQKKTVESGGKTVPWKLTNEEISAQVFVFFLGGFDTAAIAMSFMVYELAVNVDEQKKLQQEIDEVINARSNNGSVLTYDELTKMKYMDMVVCETFRKWTPATQIDRLCVKDYTIQPVLPHEIPLTITKGTLLMFPISAIHYDEKYFPNPNKFDPERFNDENRINIKPYSYIPFGLGPRVCIGNRFAILEMKVLIFHLLSKYDLSCTSKSTVPIMLDPKDLMIKVLGGFNVGLKLRKTK